MTWVDGVGYLATILVVVSLAMASTVRLRVINLFGCVAFAIYGVLTHAWPVVISNGIIAVLDVYYLWQLSKPEDHVTATPLRSESAFVEDFLSFHREDIRKSQPGFAGVTPKSMVWLLSHDMLPAGLLVVEPDGGHARVVLDYVTPAFRDNSLGRWLYNGPGKRILTDAGFTRVISDGLSPAYRRYLTQVGFHADGSDLVKDL